MTPTSICRVQIPALTKRELAMRAAMEREPMRVVVLRALKAMACRFQSRGSPTVA